MEKNLKGGAKNEKNLSAKKKTKKKRKGALKKPLNL